jgi:hypothetical protein
MCEALEGLACVAAQQPDTERAAALLALADTHRDRRSLPRRHDDAASIEALREQLGETASTSPPSSTQSLEDAAHEVLRS